MKTKKTVVLMIVVVLLSVLNTTCSSKKEKGVCVRLLTDLKPLSLDRWFGYTEAYLAEDNKTKKILYLSAKVVLPFNKGDILKAVIKPVVSGGVNLYASVSLTEDCGIKYFNKKIQVWEIIKAKKEEKCE